MRWEMYVARIWVIQQCIHCYGREQKYINLGLKVSVATKFSFTVTRSVFEVASRFLQNLCTPGLRPVWRRWRRWEVDAKIDREDIRRWEDVVNFVRDLFRGVMSCTRHRYLTQVVAAGMEFEGFHDNRDTNEGSFSRISGGGGGGNLYIKLRSKCNSCHPNVLFESAAVCSVSYVTQHRISCLCTSVCFSFVHASPSIELGKNRTAAVVAWLLHRWWSSAVESYWPTL
jgi:hypothetical protein